MSTTEATFPVKGTITVRSDPVQLSVDFPCNRTTLTKNHPSGKNVLREVKKEVRETWDDFEVTIEINSDGSYIFADARQRVDCRKCGESMYSSDADLYYAEEYLPDKNARRCLCPECKAQFDQWLDGGD